MRHAPKMRMELWVTQVTIVLYAHGQTSLSLLVSKSNEQSHAVWIRRSEISVERWLDATRIELTIPEWLARVERLI